MVICKEGNFAFIGETMDEAYNFYITSEECHNMLTPEELEWYDVKEFKVSIQKVVVNSKGK